MTPEQKTRALEVGRRIAAAREQNSYTQDELARRIGITSSAIAQYETGRTMPKPLNAQKIAMECGVSLDWLWEGDKAGGKVEARTTAERDAIVALRNMPAELHEAAVAQLQALARAVRKKS